MYRFIFIFIAIASLMTPFGVEAQTALPRGQERLVLEITPKIPRANAPVVATVKSYLLDINRTYITWYLNGEKVSGGIGETKFNFRSGVIGSTYVVRVTAETANGELHEKEAGIRPAEIDLYWEAQSYTPPFYKGKALASYEGAVKVVAMPSMIDPDGNVVDASELVYTWKKDNKVVAAQSGYGKSTFVFRGSKTELRPRISVTAVSIDGALTAEGSVRVEAEAPKVLLYEDNPLLGVMFEKAFGSTVTLKKEELTVRSVPYFFSLAQNIGVQRSWKVNGQRITENGASMTLRRGASAGRATIGISITTPTSVLQKAARELSVIMQSS